MLAEVEIYTYDAMNIHIIYYTKETLMKRTLLIVVFIFLLVGCNSPKEPSPEEIAKQQVQASEELFTNYAVDIIQRFTPQWEYREVDALAWGENIDGYDYIKLEKDLLRRWVFTSRDGMEYKTNQTGVMILWDGVTVDSRGNPDEVIIFEVTSFGITHIKDMKYNEIKPFYRDELESIVSNNDELLGGDVIGGANFE